LYTFLLPASLCQAAACGCKEMRACCANSEGHCMRIAMHLFWTRTETCCDCLVCETSDSLCESGAVIKLLMKKET
jgi:hypothetical protein